MDYSMAISNPSVPAPIVVAPSQEWDGNDGKWSTFTIRIGTPGQDFRVLPSTYGSETIIPIPEGCVNFTDSTTTCGTSRGAYNFSGFLTNKSSTWHELGSYGVDLRKELNYTVNGLCGLDNVGLGVQNTGGPTLSNQVVAGYADTDFYIGLYGISPNTISFPGFDDQQKSYLETLKNTGMIPSLSFGYTAGAWYTSPKTLGSLTLGGYDQSRFSTNNITFPFDPDDTHPLRLKIQRISARNTFNETRSLLDEEIYVQIDSTVPHLWLPRETCDWFEKLFHLTYDAGTDLYAVNDSVHNSLIGQNPELTFTLGTSKSPSEQVNIVMPYSAFDLQASHPIYKDVTNYFPIRRGANDTQFTLGRTFLQEAYIVVGHERKSFSVHQALFPATNVEQRIVPILAPKYRNESTPADPMGPRGRILSKGAIVGMAVGIPCFFLLCFTLCALIFLYKRHERQKASSLFDNEQTQEYSWCGMHELHEDKKSKPEIQNNELFEMRQPENEIDGTSKAELEGNILSELPDNASVRKASAFGSDIGTSASSS